MKFKDIARGTRAEKAATFPYPAQDGGTVDMAVLFRPLTDAEENAAHIFALEHSAAKKVPNAGPGQPVYDSAFMAQALAAGCLDPESPKSARTSFFDSASEVLDNLTRDQRVYLFELLEEWQDECSPSLRKMSTTEMLNQCDALARGGPDAERFLDRMSPATQRRCMLFMASPLWTSRAPSSPSGSPATSTSTPESGS